MEAPPDRQNRRKRNKEKEVEADRDVPGSRVEPPEYPTCRIGLAISEPVRVAPHLPAGSRQCHDYVCWYDPIVAADEDSAGGREETAMSTAACDGVPSILVKTVAGVEAARPRDGAGNVK